MNILEKAKALEKYTVAFRRELHAQPEISLQEFNTSRRVKEELDRHGIPFREIGDTGILAEIVGPRPGPTVLLRGDMDALTVQEELDLPYASKVDGVMHACGHDCHTAMLLSASVILNDMKEELSGTVRLVFQPGEEVAKGAQLMYDAGALEGVDACYSSHVMGDKPYGVIGISEGPAFASAAIFEIHVQGKGGHGALPHNAVDSIVASAAIINGLQTIVSRESNPQTALVLTVGEIHAGTRFNVIADSAHMTGTVRTFDPELQKRAPEMMERIISGIAAAYRVDARLDYKDLCGVTVNDLAMVELADGAAGKLFEAGRVIHCPPVSGSEDFSVFSAKRPSVYALLGSGALDRPVYGNHSGKFFVDERVLVDGTAMYAQFALDYLNRG